MLRPRQSDVLSLFGATPEQIRQRQLEAERDFLAQSQSDPYQSAGAAIGVGLSRLFGGKSKELQEAEQRQEAVQGIDELGAMAEAEARQRGMAPMSMAEPDVLMREANRLQSVSTAFRNLGQDTGELDNEVLRLRVEADKATRARELDDLRIRNQELQIARGEFDLSADKEDRPLIRKSRQLQFEIAGLDRQIKQGAIADKKEEKEKLTRVRNNTVSFFDDIENDPSASVYSRLVKDEIIEPANAIKGWQDAKQTGIDVTEIGAYTNAEGQEIIGAVDKKNGQLYQLTDAGWMVIPSEGWTQGPPTAGGTESARVKGGASVAKGSPKFKQYNRVLDTLVDTGIFDMTGDSADKVSERLGLDVTSTIGKEELFRLAEIEYNRQLDAGNIVTEAQVLRALLSGEQLATPASEQAEPAGDQFAGKPIKQQ